jgi:hypothetical protein
VSAPTGCFGPNCITSPGNGAGTAGAGKKASPSKTAIYVGVGVGAGVVGIGLAVVIMTYGLPTALVGGSLPPRLVNPLL